MSSISSIGVFSSCGWTHSSHGMTNDRWAAELYAQAESYEDLYKQLEAKSAVLEPWRESAVFKIAVESANLRMSCKREA